jgi:hypothetical protein
LLTLLLTLALQFLVWTKKEKIGTQEEWSETTRENHIQ